MGTVFRNAIVGVVLLVIGWAIYNAYILGGAVGGVLLFKFGAEGVLFFYIVAVVFSVIAATWAKAWWAMIPAGFAASYAVVVAADNLIPHQSFPAPPGSLSLGVFTWVAFAGFAATFGAMWLWRRSRPTDWAKYPAVGLLALSIATLILGARFQEVWLQTTLLVTGATIGLALVTRKRLPAGQPSQLA